MTDDTPATATDQHLLFLDALRQSGATNIDGAEAYLREAFPDLSQGEAQAIVLHWMRTFAERHPEGANGGGHRSAPPPRR